MDDLTKVPNRAARPTPLASAEADQLGDEIAELSAHLDAATQRLLTLIRRFDEGVGWNAHGALSCSHWLCWRIGLELGAARERVRVARALGQLPRIDAALARGEVSYSKVRALTRVATPENEASLLEMARSSTASQLERICRGYRRAVRGVLGTHPEDEADRRWVRERETESGMVRIEAQVGPEEAGVVRKAIELAMSRAWRADGVSAGISGEASGDDALGDDDAENRTTAPVAPPTADFAKLPPREKIPPSLKRADALVAVAETYLASASDSATAPIEVVVHVDAADLAAPHSQACGTLEDGTPLARATVERLSCDAAVRRVTEDSRGNALDVGRRRRTIPTALRRALHLRDRGCRFPGCTNRRVDGHHVVPWSRGGDTKLGNLLSLCRRHHRFVHEYGFQVESTSAEGRDGFRFRRPNGTLLADAPARSCRAPEPVRALLERHHAAGLAIDAQTSFSQWDGTRPDYGYIVEVLVARSP